jgi:hypothetical protein
MWPQLDYLLCINLGLYSGSYTRAAAFGHNPAVNSSNTPSDLWSGGGLYPWPSAAVSLELQGGVNDTAAGTGARAVLVSGLDTNYQLQTETVVPNGTNWVPLTKQFLRINSAVITSAGADRTSTAGITIRRVVGSTVQAVIPANKSMTRQSAFTVPAGQTLVVVGMEAGLISASGSSTRYADVDTYFRGPNGVARAPRPIACADGQPTTVTPRMGIVVPEKTDFSMQCAFISAAQDTSVTGAWEGFLRKNDI